MRCSHVTMETNFFGVSLRSCDVKVRSCLEQGRENIIFAQCYVWASGNLNNRTLAFSRKAGLDPEVFGLMGLHPPVWYVGPDCLLLAARPILVSCYFYFFIRVFLKDFRL